MTISIKSPTSTTSKIQQNGSDVLTVDSSNNVTVTNNLSVSGTVSSTGAITFNGGITGNVAFDTDTLYVDATNNAVLVGKTSIDYTTVGFEATPNSVFQANAMTSDGTRALLISRKTNDGELIQFRRDTTQVGSIGAVSGGIYFGSGTSSTERMRIDSSGRVSIGTTLNPAGAALNVNNTLSRSTGFIPCISAISSASAASLVSIGTSTGLRHHIIFENGAAVGSITTSGSATAYNTSSDYRLKENVALMSDSIDRLKKLKPSTWTWRQDGSHGEGFIAHETQAVVPEAVTGTKDAMRTEEYEVTPEVLDDDGNVVTRAIRGTREVPDYQGIDQSKLVPLLTAALQEAITKIEDLETRIQALENPS